MTAASNKARWLVVIQTITLILLADQVYSRFFIETYASAGYPDQQRGLPLLLIFWTLGVLPSFWMPTAIIRPSQILFWSVYLMVYVPTAVVAGYSKQSTPDVFFMLLVMLVGLGILSLSYRLPYLALPRMHVPPTVFWLGLGMLSLFFYVVIWVELGSIIRIVSLDDIYVQRLALMDSGASPIAGYAQAWTPLIIMPVIMAYALIRKNRVAFLLGILGTMFFFAVSAQRIFLVGPALLILVFFVFRDHGRRFAVKWLGGAMAFFTIPFMLQVGAQRYPWMFVDIVLNRSFINSGVLSTWYFDFFSFNPKVNFADVRGVSWFVSSPYSVSYKEELGWYFWGERTDPNAHFMADGFAQLGYTGVLIECVVAAVLFWLLDSVCRQRRHDLRFVVTAIAMQIPNFMNSAIHTTLIGGGFLFGLALLYFVPSPVAQPEGLSRGLRGIQDDADGLSAPSRA